MRVAAFILFFSIFSLSLSAAISVEDIQAPIRPIDNPRPQYWPSKMWRTIVEGGDQLAYSFIEILYDSINSFNLKISDHNYVRTDLKLKRQVFDNQDVLNSYTVMDYLNFEAKSKNLRLEAPFSMTNASFGVSLGVKGTLEWLNIRQVLASAYSELPLISQKYEKDTAELQEQTEAFSPNEFWDPSFRPRTSRLWNMITFPVRIPFTPFQLGQMENGELISWSINGYVELGPDVGFRILPESLTQNNGNVTAYFRNFLKGKYRVTVLKENDRFVRVKLSKEKSYGHRYGIGPTNTNLEIFEGFLIFEGSDFQTRILQQKVSMIPFNFEVKKEYAQTFDVGYRFDLSDPLAHEAFYKSVWGSFYKAYELQGRRNSQNDLIVERLFRKRSQVTTHNSTRKLDLTFFTRNLGKQSQSTKARIFLSDGEHLVFKEVTSVDKGWKLAWGRFEKLNYSFNIALDKTAYLKGKKDTYQLVVEANLQDSHTTGPEMQRYIRTVEQALGNDSLLPDLPAFVPLYMRFNTDDDYIYPENIALKLAKYRRSTFYYGFNITQDQIVKFIKTPKEKMWGILEKTFGIPSGKWSTRARRRLYRTKHIFSRIANVPLFLANVHLRKGGDIEAAKKIYNNWVKLQANFLLDENGNEVIDQNIEKKLKILSNLFEVKHFGHELLRLLLFSLDDSELDYFLVATNNSFGRIQQRGKVTTNPEYLLNLTDTAMDFERLAGGFKSNPKLVVKDLKMKVLDNESVKVSFHLNHTPKLIYFKMFKANRFQKYKVIAELVFRNNKRFKEGYNDFIISKKSIDELSYNLGEPLILKNFYNLTISTSMDRFSWSKVASKRLYYDIDDNLGLKSRAPISAQEITEELFDWEKQALNN